MVHFVFLLKTSHLKEHHKIGFTIFGSQKLEIWFLQESQKSRFWIKEKEGSEVTLTAGPACQGRLPHSRGDSHWRFLRDGEVSGQTKGTIVTARHLRLDGPPFPHGGATGNGSPSIMAARRSPQAGRARPRVSYSTSGLRQSFLGRRLGLRRGGRSWPRESLTPAETRRRCASCPAPVERPPSGANAC